MPITVVQRRCVSCASFLKSRSIVTDLHGRDLDPTRCAPRSHTIGSYVLAYETGVTNTVDPLGGAYFVEAITQQMQQDARAYFERIEGQGGMIAAIETGFFRREIADAAFVYQQEVDARRKLIVGVNAFVESDEKPMETLVIGEAVEKDQVAKIKGIKAQRDDAVVQRCLGEVRRVAATTENLMPVLLVAARARCTVGEIMAALADVFGRYDGAAKW
jgi:methylmalonyl-CoA mutase, N-terminal domain